MARTWDTNMNCRVIFVEPAGEVNLGLVARAMKNFGVDELYLVRPRVSIHGKAVMYAMHAADVLSEAKVVKTLEEAAHGLDLIAGTTAKTSGRPANIRRAAVSAEEAGEILANFSGKFGILLGREDFGLSNQELDRCSLVITVPTNREYKVLNVSTAAGIIFYELFKATGMVSSERVAADATVRKMIMEQINKLVGELGIPIHRKRLTSKAFQNVIERSYPSMREGTLILGFLRRIAHQLAA